MKCCCKFWFANSKVTFMAMLHFLLHCSALRAGKIFIQWTRTFLVASLCVTWSSQCVTWASQCVTWASQCVTWAILCVTELSHFCAFVRKTVKDPLSPAAPCDASRILKYICPSTISQFCSWNQILSCYQFWQHTFHSARTFQAVGCLFLIYEVCCNTL